MRLTPDGQRYLAMGRGEAQPMPFHLRPLIPWICRDSEVRWVVTTYLSAATAAALTGVLAHQHGAGLGGALFAAMLLLGLPWLRFVSKAPVLVDMPGLALALGAAVLASVDVMAGVILAGIGAAASEKTPILAALFAWNPLLLAGSVVSLLVWARSRPAAPDKHLYSGLRVGLRAHRGVWRDPARMVLPWGVCLAVLVVPTLWVGAALALGYGQLLVATDTVRLYQTVAPVLCVVAALTIPPEWYVPALVAHWFNPWAGDGV